MCYVMVDMSTSAAGNVALSRFDHHMFKNSSSRTTEVTGYCQRNNFVNDWRAEISLVAKACDCMNLEHAQRAGCVCVIPEPHSVEQCQGLNNGSSISSQCEILHVYQQNVQAILS